MDDEPLIPIRAAAKSIGRSERVVRRELIDTGLCAAYRWGGTAESPRLRVKMSELRGAMLRHFVYAPPLKQESERAYRRRPATIHPAALDM